MKKLFVISALLMLTTTSFAQKECQGEMVVPSYYCINPKGGVDVRLNIMEFQTCKDGKIEQLDRTISVMRFDGPEITSAEEKDIEITYQSSRSYYERSERVDDLTFLYPESVRAINGDTKIVMTMTNKLQPIFPGAYETHMPGSFEIQNQEGKVVKKGKLSCMVIR